MVALNETLSIRGSGESNILSNHDNLPSEGTIAPIFGRKASKDPHPLESHDDEFFLEKLTDSPKNTMSSPNT